MTLTQITKAGLHDIALDHVFTIGASGTDHYTFQGEGLNGTVNDPTLYLTRGKTYRFENGTGAHPIRIQSTSGASGTAYNTGVTNNASSGTVIVEVQHDAPDVLYYQCTSHANMNGVLYITGALADGGVTTAKLADDAVTDAKLANSINTAIAANTAKSTNATHTGDVTGSGSLTIASGAVTTAKIADSAVTTAKIATGSVTTGKLEDGGIISAKIADNAISTAKLATGSVTTGKLEDGGITAGKLASGVQTTINNNANNRLITGSGTANTLEGESSFTYNNGVIDVEGTGAAAIQLKTPNSTDGGLYFRTGSTNAGALSYLHSNNSMNFRVNSTNKMTINSSGHVAVSAGFIGSSTTDTFTLNGKTQPHYGLSLSATSSSPIGISGYYGIAFASQGTERMRVLNTGGLTFNGDTANANALDDYEEGTWTPTGSGFTVSTVYSARYTKIGRIVHASTYLQVATGSGTSSQPIVLGLPYNSYGGNTYSYGTGRVGSASGNTLSQNNIVWQVQQGVNQVKIYVNDGGINEAMISGQHMIFSVVYEAA